MADTRPLIAIVDDEESVRVALRRLCGAYGLDTRTFESAGQLFDSLHIRLPDCLILDAHMPGFGGVDAQVQLRERGISIPAVIITGRDDDEVRARAHAIASAYLCKPVDAEVLLGAIKDAIGADARVDDWPIARAGDSAKSPF